MGWLWSSPADKDPYQKLDPALREFLDKESPVKYQSSSESQSQTQKAAETPSGDGPQTSYRAQMGLPVISPEQQQQQLLDKPAVPAESLYQDGRYAHLWKNYRPQGEIDAVGKSDQDRLADVISAYQDRKAAIGRAAMENCVEYQIAEQECFRGGMWRKGLGLCREEAREFNRCYEMQQRFLKALGYLSDGLSVPGREGEEEKIQMHADKLYNEMLGREKALEEAKKEGRDVSQIQKEPFLRTETGVPLAAPGDKETAWTKLRQHAGVADPNAELDLAAFAMPSGKADKLKEKWKGMSPTERQLELELLEAEARSVRPYADKVTETFEQERQRRAERRERGRETVGDTIKRWAGWDG
ncbi:hypothetical protein K431DRAFT_288618 [Polychaeton citri CBS 116435]|uniref:Uncharacterized protein n=1 Tax=Polychaeton citri CBS 116435 TaxID=1314669 RepID=A0A9P4UIW7_9PEZI|nr:hypothetical protein K431DRAFT_288618 [Polychaeton citri CBS 116435]